MDEFTLKDVVLQTFEIATGQDVQCRISHYSMIVVRMSAERWIVQSLQVFARATAHEVLKLVRTCHSLKDTL
jgi:hypothetical protein